MDGDNVHDQGDNGGLRPGDHNLVLLQVGLDQNLSPPITDELESYVPRELPTSGVISTPQKFNALHARFYDTLRVQPGAQPNERYLVTTFCDLNDQGLEAFRGIIPELTGVQANPIGMFHVLYLLKNATVNRTREQKTQVVTAMANVNVNAILRAGLVEQGDNDQEADYLITLFNRFINILLASVTMLHQKSRLGIISYSWCNKLQTLLRKLQTKTQEMMYTLCTRNEANAVAHVLVRCRAKALESLNDYALLRDETQVVNCRMYLADFREVNQFEFGGANGLSTAVQNRTLWSTFIYQANFEATEVNELETL